ncbi:uncharacterized protein LOC107046580, partial [Diachasma alloeum]|uniref:uncharacterized protein LOC107046580 n=1 Tax=Diachasma alloeum TaxID=454923 RepID=UPI0007381EF9
ILEYLADRSILDPLQTGFRPSNSTQTALLKLTDDIRTGIDRRQLTMLILFDFSKAFDSVCHVLLLEKLVSYGFSSAAVRWIASYLSGHSQATLGGSSAFYFRILKIYLPIYTDNVIKVVIKIVHQEKLWKWEDLCQYIIQGLLNCGINQNKIIDGLFNKTQCKRTSLKDIRKIMRILYTILEDHSWVNDQDTETAIKRLLTLYHNSLNHCFDEKQLILKNSFEICLLNAIKHLSDWHLISILSEISLWALEKQSHDDAIILELANILEFAAQSYELDIFENTLAKELLILLLKMISSPNSSVSLVGNRVLQNLIDRKRNKLQFQALKLFFENTDYDIEINKDRRNDQDFFKEHRDLIHESFLQCVMNHCTSRINLEAIYCTICLIAVEVPCGFTAAALSCLLMNIQDLTLEHLDATHSVTYHVHAMILAIMTLICWIHKAKVFYAYVNKVLMERAQWAPHLNPPLATHYDLAIHHVLWDKPELFFVDWEVRFGLWKCFRLQTEEDYNKS